MLSLPGAAAAVAASLEALNLGAQQEARKILQGLLVAIRKTRGIAGN